jgi:hypothetical protein
MAVSKLLATQAQSEFEYLTCFFWFRFYSGEVLGSAVEYIKLVMAFKRPRTYPSTIVA